jgi:hypothetical protein
MSAGREHWEIAARPGCCGGVAREACVPKHADSFSRRIPGSPCRRRGRYRRCAMHLPQKVRWRRAKQRGHRDEPGRADAHKRMPLPRCRWRRRYRHAARACGQRQRFARGRTGAETQQDEPAAEQIKGGSVLSEPDMRRTRPGSRGLGISRHFVGRRRHSIEHDHGRVLIDICQG